MDGGGERAHASRVLVRHAPASAGSTAQARIAARAETIANLVLALVLPPSCSSRSAPSSLT
jgi:hypothetical protein